MTQIITLEKSSCMTNLILNLIRIAFVATDYILYHLWNLGMSECYVKNKTLLAFTFILN